MTLSRKGAKSQTRGRKRRSTGTKAKGRVARSDESQALLIKKLKAHARELEKKLETRTRELGEAREQQTASSEVLRVISSSPGELESVFRAMLENATRICEATFGSLLLYEGDGFRRVAHHNVPVAFAEHIARQRSIRLEAVPTLARLVATKRVVHVADIAVESPHEPIARLGEARTLLVVGQGERADRRLWHLPPGGPAVHREADRAGPKLRQPSRHRY